MRFFFLRKRSSTPSPRLEIVAILELMSSIVQGDQGSGSGGLGCGELIFLIVPEDVILIVDLFDCEQDRSIDQS